MEAFTCDGCGFTSFSKMLFQDHNCAMNKDPGSPGRYCRRAPSPPPVETVCEAVEEMNLPPLSPQKNEMPIGVSDFDESDFLNPEDAPFRCICGYSSFSQLLFEDHDCKFVAREVIHSSVKATTVSRLKEAGLQIERRFARESAEQGPQTVIVKTSDSGKVLFGPKPMDKATTVGKLVDTILQASGQPWASLTLYHKEKELSADVSIGGIFERTIVFTATVESAALDIHARKTYFNRFPDVITEVLIRPQKEENFQEYVATVQEQLRKVSSRYRSSNASTTDDVTMVDPPELVTNIEEKPKNLSCVSFGDCISKEQLEQVRAFVAKAGKVKMWKHESFGQYHVLAWAAGHEFRLTIISEDGPSRYFVSTMSRDPLQRRTSC